MAVMGGFFFARFACFLPLSFVLWTSVPVFARGRTNPKNTERIMACCCCIRGGRRRRIVVAAPTAALLLLLVCLSICCGRGTRAWTLVDRFMGLGGGGAGGFGGGGGRGGSSSGRLPRPRPRGPPRVMRAARAAFSRGDGSESSSSSAPPPPPNSSNNNKKSNEPRRRRRSNQQSRQDLLRFMDEPMASTVGDADRAGSGGSLTQEDDDGELLDLVRCVAKAADGRKADDIVALYVRHISTLASALVIVSGNSRPQNQAIAAAVTKDVLEKFGLRPGGSGVPEGSAESGWMLLDYGSVMVHIMSPKARLFYNVEGQWKDKGGRYLDLSDVLVPNNVAEERTALDKAGFAAKEDDPFWS